MTVSLKGLVPESWLCVDCGVHTAPGVHTASGFLNRTEMEEAIKAAKVAGKWGSPDDGIKQTLRADRAEVYTVREAVWARAGMQPMGGCLCIGCLEKRLGRRLKPRDFERDNPLNQLPSTARLMKRQKITNKLSPWVAPDSFSDCEGA